MAILCRAAKNSLRGTDAHSLPKYPFPVIKPFNLREIIKVYCSSAEGNSCLFYWHKEHFRVGNSYSWKPHSTAQTKLAANTSGRHITYFAKTAQKIRKYSLCTSSHSTTGTDLPVYTLVYCKLVRRVCWGEWAGSLKMNTALEYSTRVVQEGGRRSKKSTQNDLVHLTPLRIPLMNPPNQGDQRTTVGNNRHCQCQCWEVQAKMCGPSNHKYSKSY